jgi:hypothetical protein
MGEWKQEEYPKRMAADIKKVKEERRQKQQEAIKAAAAHVTAELAQPIHRRAVPHPVIQRTFKKRVAAIQNQPLANNFPYTSTKRARRHMKKHPGVPVPQHSLADAAKLSEAFNDVR